MSVLGRVVLAGPLQGRVVPSMCMWALLPALRDSDGSGDGGGDEKPVEGTARLRHHRIQLSLEKGTTYILVLSCLVLSERGLTLPNIISSFFDEPRHAGFEHRDIWASALQREYLLALKKSS